MSKELAFTDDNDVVKYLDTTTAFNLALTADGVAFDLTNAKSILVKIANDDGYIMQQTIDLTTVTSSLGGTLSFPINQDIMNTLVPDDYDIEVWVTMNDGTQAIFPSDGTLGFSIEENLMSDTGEVIPTITLNDFQQQFDDLSSQMENAVHNVQKGDQGNPGNGIKSANNQYQLSDSPVTVPTGGWSDTILATTDQLPYLWTKIIFIYDDGTTKETNFVSSRGDTGSQGPIGPEGPQGKQGNGLVVRGKADKEENLPTTGNNQGDGYLVGTDLYIWIDGSWQNMGSITPDLADYVKVADMNNALNTKVNVTDMRKPASDVAGIEEVNAKQDKISYTPADDSKVAHLSGANNFDTVPTVDKNPLLLASSLPSDLARTGSDQEFTGKNTFDTAPIDKTTGHPYITKDGVPAVPSTLADTTKDANFTGKLQKSGIDVATTTDVKNAVNTATANMANTTKLANFTAGLQVNGKDVGTGGGDKLTTPWVVTNYQTTDTMGPHGCNEATGWRIYNDILYYYGNFWGATVSETIVFNLYTAYPDFKKTFKTLGSSPELIYQTPLGFWAFNDWGNQMVGNEGNLLISIKNTATPLSVNIVYPLDRL
ncbi:phage baseplate upper protein [Lentilactobacillus parabuchneri]|uniref:phage baseplate upper protein n=1 Tax=Lentilactobacillus parabuchneri TaxID=152331 RepID=UPI001C4EE82D|nr:phage baseplate upper protein [Lentilactobacillus parabuchneri]MBW0262607.1 phage baseplate upper protein [Lentilactobacillus parabuchneri]